MKSAFSIIIAMIILAIITALSCSDDKVSTSNGPDTTLNVPPNAPSDPSPANGATGIGINTVFSWQASDPDPNDTLRYDCYLGVNPDSNLSFQMIGHNWSRNSHDSQWLNQSRAKLLLGQIYSMQNAYRQGHNAYCLNGVMANYWNNDFSLLNILIDSTNCYSYTMMAEVNTFICTATANLDADATMDTWTINQDSVLVNTIDDTIFYLRGYAYYPNTIYYWKIVAKDNHGNETSGPLWRFTTGPDSL
jgi:hypothetical protein